MKNTEMESGLLPTLEECQQMTFLPQIVGALDFHAKTSALPTQQEETDFKEIVQACFSELCTFLDKSQKKKDPTPYSLKMLEICLALMGDGTSPGFSLKWIGGGTMQSGKFSTLNISDQHKTESVCSLWDILESPKREEFSQSKKQRTEFLKRYNATQVERD